jgi:hypothetical protein
MAPFFFESDFELTPAGTFREATAVEVIRQDVVHLIEEADELGEPSVEVFVEELRSQLVEMLSSHPNVLSIDQIDVAPNPDNTLAVSVYVNGEPLAITATSQGGR